MAAGAFSRPHRRDHHDLPWLGSLSLHSPCDDGNGLRRHDRQRETPGDDEQPEQQDRR
jgi:hypothetical protein